MSAKYDMHLIVAVATAFVIALLRGVSGQFLVICGSIGVVAVLVILSNRLPGIRHIRLGSRRR